MNIVLGNIHKATRSAIRKARAMWGGDDERAAVALSKQLPQSRLVVNEDAGFVRFESADFGFGEEVERLAQLARDWMLTPARNEHSDKPFLRNILKSEDLFEHPEFIRVATHEQLLGAVTQYLGQVPVLLNLHLWWTPPNSTVIRSQRWHYDHRDTRQAKIFINLSDVEDDAGPLHFLSATSSLKVDKKVGYSQGRYMDEQIDKAIDEQEILKATGPIGTGFIVDTARCLHFGSRGNVTDRLVLMICYTRINCVSKGTGCEVLDPVRERLTELFFKNDAVRTFSNRRV